MIRKSLFVWALLILFLCLTGAFAVAQPKALRWSIWHTPARIVRRARRNVVRILDGWPTADALLDAYQRIALIT